MRASDTIAPRRAFAPLTPHPLVPGGPARARQVPRGWWLMLGLSLAVAAYALAYVVLGDRMYPPNLADSFRARPWGIYTHAAAALFALAIGPLQFHGRLRARRQLHRNLGRLYVAAALVTGATGVYMSAYSYGGLVPHLGFGTLGAAVLVTTAAAYARIGVPRMRNVRAHQEWMTRSFALVFAAVTLRLLLPLLVVAHGGAFDPAYRWVSWLCWVPNLLWAEWLVRRSRPPAPAAGLQPT
jgi:uncharacterized membrane protein